MDDYNCPRHSTYDVAPQNPLARLEPLRRDVTLRRQTFDRYPRNAAVPKNTFVDNGFYYIGNGYDDKVQCVYCGGVLKSFNVHDSVPDEHARFFPFCPFVKNAKADSMADFSFSSPRANRKEKHDLEEDGDLECDGTTAIKSTISEEHKYPDFKDKAARLKSFCKWPKDSVIKDINMLAEAGLFYTGCNDRCLCYSCGHMLEEWEEGDIPKKEHDKYFWDCQLATPK